MIRKHLAILTACMLALMGSINAGAQPTKVPTFSGINAPDSGGYTNADYNSTFVVPYKEKVGSLTTWELKTPVNAQGAYLHVLVQYRSTGKIWQVIQEVVHNESPYTYTPIYSGMNVRGWTNLEPYGGTVVLP